MTLRKWSVTLLVGLFCGSLPLGACSAFIYQKSGNILLAKNLDWPVGDGWVVSNPAGVHKTAFLLTGGAPLTWKSRYFNVTFNQLGPGLPLGGMNEKGLVIEELSYSLSRYPKGSKVTTNEFQWIQYQLDQSDGVDAVHASLEQIGISPVLVGLHYLICDRRGNAAILEFIDEQVRWYSGDQLKMPVLTNNRYDHALDYLHRHRGFGGDMPVHQGPESPDRFVRICTQLQLYRQMDVALSFNTAFEILNSVSQDDTQWRIVYDPQNGEILFKRAHKDRPGRLRIRDLSGAKHALYRNLELPGRDLKPSDFGLCTSRNSQQLMRSVLERLIRLEEISREKADAIFQGIHHSKR